MNDWEQFWFYIAMAGIGMVFAGIALKKWGNNGQ